MTTCQRFPGLVGGRTVESAERMHSMIWLKIWFANLFSSRKFGVASSPFVVKLHLVYIDRASSSSEMSHYLGNDPTWVVIGAVTAKPVSYTGIRLFVNTGLNFGIKTDNNIPCGDSLHRIFKELIGKHVSNGGSKEDISAQVGFRSLETIKSAFLL